MTVELCVFLAWLAARVPWFRGVAEDGWNRFLVDAAWGCTELPEAPGFTIELLETATGERWRDSFESARPFLRSGQWAAVLGQNDWADLMRVQAWYFRHKHFPTLSWALLTAPEGLHFVASDRPLAWYVRGLGFVESPGALSDPLSRPLVEVTVPLDSKHPLIGFGGGVDTNRKIHVDLINERTMGSAERFVVSPTADFGQC